MYRVAKEFKFCASHRLDTSFTEACQRVHGHNYRVFVVLRSQSLNIDNMVIDFGKIKAHMKEVFDEWDHCMFVSKYSDKLVHPGVIEFGENPTAEAMAHQIFRILNLMLGQMTKSDREKRNTGGDRDVYVDSVKVWETDTSWAEYSE